jgi:hypothetical protein
MVDHEASVSQDYRGCDSDLHAWLSDNPVWRRISQPELAVILDSANQSQGDTHYQRAWIYLPSPSRGTMRIALMNVDWDFLGGGSRAGFQVAGFWRDGDGTCRATAWRFEGPETSADDGSPSHHGYFHAQPCQRLRTRHGDVAVGLDPAQAWPSDGPTFPLDAQSPIDLLVCVLVALYGRRQAAELVRESGQVDIEQRLRGLRTMTPAVV